MSSPISFKDGHSGSVPEAGNAEKTSEPAASSYNTSEYEDQLRAAAPKLRGRKLSAALAFVAGTGFTLFGCVAPAFLLASQLMRLHLAQV